MNNKSLSDFRAGFLNKGTMYYECFTDNNNPGPSYGQVIDIIFTEESSGADSTIIPIAEVKNFCKIDIDEDDALLDELQLAAINICEGATNIGFRFRTIEAVINNGYGGAYLPYGPVDTVTTIDTKTPETNQVLGVKWKQIDWPRTNRVTVIYTAGYRTLPFDLKTGLLQCIFYLYDERKRSENAYPPIYKETLNRVSRK